MGVEEDSIIIFRRWWWWCFGFGRKMKKKKE
jgi:hypothetical protein